MGDNIDYIHKHENVVYIFSLGAGSKYKEFSDYEFKKNNIVEIIDYKTVNNFLGIPIRDFLDVRDDIKKIRAEKPITEKYRLKKLFELLLLYLLNTKLDIVLIGFSHGCVIIHGAILKLKMKIQKSSYIDRITIMAVNSPNLIPPEIIDTDRTNKVFNIYNIKDNILSLGNFFRITKNDYLPDLSHSHIKTLNFTKGKFVGFSDKVIFEYFFDKYKRIIYINIENIFNYLKISKLLLRQLLRHSAYLNLIVLFKTLNSIYYSPLFLINFNMRLQNLFLFDNFIEFDRYLYLENNVPKDTQITIIQNTNYNDLLELLDEREFSHLYLYFFPLEEIDIDVFEIIDLLPDDFIVNKLNLLTFNELKLLLRGEAKIYNISIENRHKLLSIFKKEGKINLIKIAMRIDLKKNKSYAETVRNIFIVLYFMYNMEIKGVLNMLILNDDNKKKI